MTNIDTIHRALATAMTGDPAPTFGSPEFRELVAAINAVTLPGHAHVQEAIGRRALALLLDHYDTSMQAERTLAVMRDNGESLC